MSIWDIALGVGAMALTGLIILTVVRVRRVVREDRKRAEEKREELRDTLGN